MTLMLFCAEAQARGLYSACVQNKQIANCCQYAADHGGHPDYHCNNKNGVWSQKSLQEIKNENEDSD